MICRSWLGRIYRSLRVLKDEGERLILQWGSPSFQRTSPSMLCIRRHSRKPSNVLGASLTMRFPCFSKQSWRFRQFLPLLVFFHRQKRLWLGHQAPPLAAGALTERVFTPSVSWRTRMAKRAGRNSLSVETEA